MKWENEHNTSYPNENFLSRELHERLVCQANVSNVRSKTRAAREEGGCRARRREKETGETGEARGRERNERVSERGTRTAVRGAQLYLCLVVVRIMRRWVNCQVKSEMAANEQQRKVSERRMGTGTGTRTARILSAGGDVAEKYRGRRQDDEVSRDRTLSFPRDETRVNGASLLCQKSRLIRRLPLVSRLYICIYVVRDIDEWRRREIGTSAWFVDGARSPG